LALGTAYPVTLVESWSLLRRPRLAPLVSGALCLAVAGAFLVDIHPYRSYYRLQVPDFDAAQSQIVEALSGQPGERRIATLGDPGMIDAILRAREQVSIGWPHPLAGKDLWTVTGQALVSSPVGYRDSALGLSATAYLVQERSSKPGQPTVGPVDVTIEPNPMALPEVRAYEQAVVVPDPDLGAGLAVKLAHRHVGVVTGGPAAASSLGGMAVTQIADPGSCDRLTLTATEVGGQDMAGEVASTCAISRWVGSGNPGGVVSVGTRPGGIFRSMTSGLRGVTVLFDRDPGPTELVLRQVGSDGRTLDREVVRTRSSGTDVNGMAAFRFDPIPESSGRTYGFELSCDACSVSQTPKTGYFEANRDRGDLLVGGALKRSRLATFSLLYDELSPAPPPATTVHATRSGPGRWALTTSGQRASLVVVADAWFPGWHARVDGRAVPVLKADGAFLGIPVGTGTHQITLDYRRPYTTPVGRSITALTLMASTVFFVLPPLRRRVRRGHRAHIAGAGSGPDPVGA